MKIASGQNKPAVYFCNYQSAPKQVQAVDFFRSCGLDVEKYHGGKMRTSKQFRRYVADMAISANKEHGGSFFGAHILLKKYGNTTLTNFDERLNVMSDKQFKDLVMMHIDDINYQAGIDKLQKKFGFSNVAKKEYLNLRKINDKKEFMEKFYAKVVSDSGYGKHAPRLKLVDNPKMGYLGEMDHTSNTIIVNIAKEQCRENGTSFTVAYYKEDGSIKCRAPLVGNIIHELTHFQQYIDVYRAFGFEKLSEMSGKSVDNEGRLKNYPKEEIEKRKNFDFESIRAIGDMQGRIAKTSRDYKRAQKIYENNCNYTFILEDSKKYKEQYVEVEASRVESMFGKIKIFFK